MAKGSVRKKGKKWYYRFYVEDASGNLVQKEFAGTESKSETEKMLRKAMEDYDAKKFLAKADNLTLGQMLDVWAEEDLKTGSLELYHLDGTEDIPLDYNEIDLVCIRPDGAYEAPATVETALRTARKRLSELDDNFHFHTLRHTYTTNLLSNGAAPKDVQELLGHSDVSTTMNVYAHANREGKRNSARLLDKVVGE